MEERLTYYSPLLWDRYEKGTLSKRSALYHWLNSDQGQIVGEDGVFWVETFGAYCYGPNKTAFAQLKTIMKREFGLEYLYDKFPVKDESEDY